MNQKQPAMNKQIQNSGNIRNVKNNIEIGNHLLAERI